MEAALVLVCTAAGLAVGTWLPAVIERVPARRPLRDRPWRGTTVGGDVPEVRLVPLASAAVSGLVAARFGSDPALPAFLVLGVVLVVVAAIDLRHYLIPNRIVVPALVAGLVLLTLAAATTGGWGRLAVGLLGAVLAFNGLLLVHLVKPAGMGLGDVKLSSVLGLHLGWLGLGHVVLGLFLGFGLGAVVGLGLVATGVRGRKDHVPFGPFLAAGTLLAVLVGTPVLRWYGGL